jgi:RNA polymerase sigma-70 factor (ECF subfamily)
MGARMRQDENNEERMLITKAKLGNAEAFEILVRKYQQRIYYLCRGMTGSHQSADDLSQDTFIKAYFALDRFKDGMNFFSWIRKIAVNNSLNFLKKAKREEPLGENVENIRDHSSIGKDMPHEMLQRNRMEQTFSKALKALPPEQKIVFILRVFENLSYKNIAKILKISQGTVMSRLSRAREKIKLSMSEYLARRSG